MYVSKSKISKGESTKIPGKTIINLSCINCKHVICVLASVDGTD